MRVSDDNDDGVWLCVFNIHYLLSLIYRTNQYKTIKGIFLGECVCVRERERKSLQ